MGHAGGTIRQVGEVCRDENALMSGDTRHPTGGRRHRHHISIGGVQDVPRYGTLPRPCQACALLVPTTTTSAAIQ